MTPGTDTAAVAIRLSARGCESERLRRHLAPMARNYGVEGDPVDLGNGWSVFFPVTDGRLAADIAYDMAQRVYEATLLECQNVGVICHLVSQNQDKRPRGGRGALRAHQACAGWTPAREPRCGLVVG